MPPPDPARWQRVRDVFAAVADLPASDRPERLTDLCGSDDALRHEVESLLSHDRMPNDPIGDLVGAAAHAAAEAARPVRLGDTLLHYRLTERIGEGGMGIVWRAVDETLGREVAIKVLPPGVGDDPRRLARFEREAKLLASLNHTNIAAIFSLHVDAGVRFLAMEYVPGEELATRLARGRLPLDEVLRVARQIAEALEEAHERGVVHRDRGFDLSPDGTTIAAHRHDGDGGDVWIIDTARNATSRFTFDAAQDNSSPAWSPDGDRIAFASFRDGRWGVHVKPANGTGADTRAFELQEAGALSIGPMSWSPDGTSLLFAVFDRTTQWDLWRLWLTGRVHAEPVLQTDTFERHGQISPDGRWLAFMSRETGTNDTYVLGLAPAAGKWAVSSGGGTVPRWRADGRELYYLAGGRMMAVDITARGDALSIGVPVPLFDYAHANVTHPDYYPYAVSRDGQRFLVTRELPRDPRASRDAPVIVVTQWAQALAP